MDFRRTEYSTATGSWVADRRCPSRRHRQIQAWKHAITPTLGRKSEGHLRNRSETFKKNRELRGRPKWVSDDRIFNSN